MAVGNRACWYKRSAISSKTIPRSVTTWLLDEGSLTQRLVRLCGDEFHVKRLSECRRRPRLDEMRALGMRGVGQARIRQVLLCAGDTPLVYARTIIPLTTMSGSARRLAHMGDRPLGALLFSSRGMRRGPLQISRQPSEWLEKALPSGQVWGRRSVFYLAERPLLVAEFFLPSLFAMIAEKDAK